MVNQDQIIVALAQSCVLLLQIGVFLLYLAVKVVLQFVYVLYALLVPDLGSFGSDFADLLRFLFRNWVDCPVTIAVVLCDLTCKGPCLRVWNQRVTTWHPRASSIAIFQVQLGGIVLQHQTLEWLGLGFGCCLSLICFIVLILYVIFLLRFHRALGDLGLL